MYLSYTKYGWKGNVPGEGNMKAGGQFKNAEHILPEMDKNGNLIKYREFDINPRNGANRDAERFVVGSDGSVYYTQSHYSEFSKIK